LLSQKIENLNKKIIHFGPEIKKDPARNSQKWLGPAYAISTHHVLGLGREKICPPRLVPAQISDSHPFQSNARA
jgi:hypothetical protein